MKELRFVALALVLAVLTNVYAILTYDGQWIELLTQWQVTIVLGALYYAVGWIIRGLIAGIRALSARRG